MKIHEYQAKELFREYGIPTTGGTMVTSPEEAVRAAKEYGLPVLLKAQVHTGGRGKAGGVKLVRTPEDVAQTAKDVLALNIKGFDVHRLLVTPAVEIASEVYLSLLIDRGVSKVVFIGCSEGGMEIEETAKTSPEKILRLELTAAQLKNLTPDDSLPFAEKLFADPAQARSTAEIMATMVRMFRERDCSLIEINPLITDKSGQVIALDAKVLFDDNALFRHPENGALRDPDEDDPDEITAKENNVNFVRLDGNIGCMVNGAGLAMATMDIIKHFGGSPANFLDVGGSSDPKKVVAGFKLILADKNVKAIFINIFGGITRCDDIARGILTAREQIEITVPIVIRLVGTRQEEGRALLAGTGMLTADTLEQGARLAVEIGNTPSPM